MTDDTDVFEVPGLHEPVEIRIDQWGVPHLYAASQDDLFLAQGFNAARDRLFQLDLWRRRGLGLLSEVLGDEYAEHDRAARLFLYRGDMAEEWRAYGDDTERVTTAFGPAPEWASVGPVPRGGSGDTVGAAAYGPGSGRPPGPRSGSWWTSAPGTTPWR
ncbi:penicillin acylase family protein [Streptomyces sp. NPDC048441]|uniref:penicillin acylase family protein n=1 Tax=Streptomyces sp. NPDC048441 TaxID=3365552 RepID=UPI0037158B05